MYKGILQEIPANTVFLSWQYNRRRTFRKGVGKNGLVEKALAYVDSPYIAGPAYPKFTFRSGPVVSNQFDFWLDFHRELLSIQL
jgi:hypothetical protein